MVYMVIVARSSLLIENPGRIYSLLFSSLILYSILTFSAILCTLLFFCVHGHIIVSMGTIKHPTIFFSCLT